MGRCISGNTVENPNKGNYALESSYRDHIAARMVADG